MSTQEPDVSTELTAVGSDADREFYIQFIHDILEYLWSREDLGVGISCYAWAYSWLMQYQAIRNIWLPAWVTPELIPVCRCWVRQIACVPLQWTLTPEQLALWEKENLHDELTAYAFELNKELNIVQGVTYSLSFLIGTVGE